MKKYKQIKKTVLENTLKYTEGPYSKEYAEKHVKGFNSNNIEYKLMIFEYNNKYYTPNQAEYKELEKLKKEMEKEKQITIKAIHKRIKEIIGTSCGVKERGVQRKLVSFFNEYQGKNIEEFHTYSYKNKHYILTEIEYNEIQELEEVLKSLEPKEKIEKGEKQE